MRTARLNVFQRLARTWDAFHPYNAAQACRVAGTFSRPTLDTAWAQTLNGLGLERIVVPYGSAYAYAAAQVTPVHHLAEDVDLAGHFTRELNRPFLDAEGPPFRPFVSRSDGSTWLGIVYQHWVADSVSIRGLLREWLVCLCTPGLARRSPVPLGQCRSRDLLASWRGGWRVDETLLSLLRRYNDNRRVRKIHTFGPLEYPVRVRLFPGPPGLLPGLLAYARSRGVKLNDVLLAALAQSCHRLIPAQQRPGRDDLALSTVADLRPGLNRATRAGFGCLLGFTTTICRRRHLNDWDRLLLTVAAQGRAQRRAGVGPAGVLWMLAAELASRYTPPGRLYDFYRKEIPLAAGISNVNLNDTWVVHGPSPAPVIDYVRVSPTGPIVPVALAVTTVRDEVQLALTYRTALLNDWTATELVQMLVGKLQRLAEERPSAP